MMGSDRMSKAMPLSYLVLTGSKTNGLSNSWVAPTTQAKYLNWISNMSQCEMLEPYSFGSSKSALVKMLENKHKGVNLSERQLYAIKAWIDLAVPCYGDYETGNIWDSNEQRWADEYTNKRNCYEIFNSLARKSRAQGSAAVNQDIAITYKSGGKIYSDVTDFSGAKKLELPTYYKSGDTLTVKLPDGEKYLGLTMDTLMGEAIIYLPDGEYNFTVPSDLLNYNRTFKNTNNKTIIARVVDKEELNNRRNLAFNPYDIADSDSYPHATANSNYGNLSQFVVRNAIDGITANDAHGAYPNHSWGPDKGSGHWMNVDFGREVSIDEVVITIRASFPHDTYFNSGRLEFYDKDNELTDSVDIVIEKTSEPQTFTFEAINAYSVKLTNLSAVDIEGDDWAAISEFEVYGKDTNTVKWSFDSEKKIIYNIPEGTTVSEFTDGLNKDVTVYDSYGNAVSEESIVCTGMKTKLDETEYLIIVNADLSGDGRINIIDLVRMKRCVSEIKATNAELYAGDYNADGVLGADDVVYIRKILIGAKSPL